MGAPDGKKKRSNLVWDPKNRRKNISPMRCKGPAEIQVKRKIFDVDVQLVLLHRPLHRKGCEAQNTPSGTSRVDYLQTNCGFYVNKEKPKEHRRKANALF